jgi:hypothetical protein
VIRPAVPVGTQEWWPEPSPPPSAALPVPLLLALGRCCNRWSELFLVIKLPATTFNVGEGDDNYLAGSRTESRSRGRSGVTAEVADGPPATPLSA